MNGIIMGPSSFAWQKEQRLTSGSDFKHFKRYRTFNRSQPLVYGRPHSSYKLIVQNPMRGYKSFIKTIRLKNAGGTDFIFVDGQGDSALVCKALEEARHNGRCSDMLMIDFLKI